jgi:hypothetical protein
MNELDKLVRAPNGEEEVRAFYGWRDEFLMADGTPAREWERDNIRPARMPAPLKFAGRPVQTLRVHRLLVDRFESVYNEIHHVGLWEAVESYAGSYAFRLIRGGESLSMHSYGAAVDHDPARNPLGAPPEQCFYGNTDAGRAVVRIFKAHGFAWGGDFHGRKDSMHWQFATGA